VSINEVFGVLDKIRTLADRGSRKVLDEVRANLTRLRRAFSDCELVLHRIAEQIPVHAQLAPFHYPGDSHLCSAKKARSKRRFRLNTSAEEARIQAGIKSDPDNPELTPEQLARMRPFRELQAERRLGRPKSAVHKEPVTVRLDPEVVDFFRSGGRGWQTRMNEALVEYVKLHRARP